MAVFAKHPIVAVGVSCAGRAQRANEVNSLKAADAANVRLALEPVGAGIVDCQPIFAEVVQAELLFGITLTNCRHFAKVS